MLDRALLFHRSVALGELATGVANADPGRGGGRRCDHYAALFASIPDSRLLTPDSQSWADAGLIAGILSRIQGFQPHQRKECLNDALILLTAAKAGLPVRTSNRQKFDLLQQIVPEGLFVHTNRLQPFQESDQCSWAVGCLRFRPRFTTRLPG